MYIKKSIFLGGGGIEHIVEYRYVPSVNITENQEKKITLNLHLGVLFPKIKWNNFELALAWCLEDDDNVEKIKLWVDAKMHK